MPIVAIRSLDRPARPVPHRTPQPYIEARTRVRKPVASTAPAVDPYKEPSAASSPGAWSAPLANADTVPKPDYEIGYGKPPKHTRFKKGQSGNKKGRPKGAKGLKTIAREALSGKVTVRTATGPKRVSKIAATVYKTIERAFAGDMRAIQYVHQLYDGNVTDEPMLKAALSDGSAIHSDEHDLAIIEAFKRSLREEAEAK